MISPAIKLTVGFIAAAGVSIPGTYYVVKHLTTKTIKEQLKNDKITEIKEGESTKWEAKIKGKESDPDLKDFIRKNKDKFDETVSSEALKESCVSALEKTTKEIDYQKFKDYCFEINN